MLGEREKNALLQYMPMFFNGLVVETTTRCNARCAMCYQAAGPRGSDLSGDASLSLNELATVIREAAEIETLHPRFHLSGGEAFLDPDFCVAAFGIAREAGFLDLTASTNAFWAKEIAKAREVCTRLREAGVTTLEISWDFWHSQWISPQAVSNCLKACRESGIEANLRILSTRSHPFGEALSFLPPGSAELANRITCGPVFSIGRAPSMLQSKEFYNAQGGLDDNCHGTLNLTVNPLGNVYPCCAGLDQTNLCLFGNIKDESIIDIAASMNRAPILRAVVFGGVGSLRPILIKAGIEIGRDFRNVCHMCWSIFTRPECVDVLEAHFSAGRIWAIQTAIEYLERRTTLREVSEAGSGHDANGQG